MNTSIFYINIYFLKKYVIGKWFLHAMIIQVGVRVTCYVCSVSDERALTRSVETRSLMSGSAEQSPFVTRVLRFMAAGEALVALAPLENLESG